MSYAIIRNENHKMNAIPLLERHNERLNKNYSNKDIDKSRSHLNYHLKQIQAPTYQQEFERIRIRQELKGNLRLHGEKQSTIMCEFIITSDGEFFNSLGAERTKQFFKDAYDFVTAKVGGEQYVVSAVVHMDEATPHMHVAFIPVIKGKDRKGDPCKRINCSEFWKGRDSYSRLQDEYYDFITSRGYDLERGVRGSTAEHLSVAEYKLKTTQEHIKEAQEQLSEIECIEEIRTTGLPLNTVAVKRDDFEKLTAAARGYVSAKKSESENAIFKSERQKLRSENETLKNENNILSGNLQQLENDFGEFYDSISDEIALHDENARLCKENERIGNQVYTLAADVLALKEENDRLKRENETDKQSISALNSELDKARSLLKVLRDKFNNVMKFIDQQGLKEKLDKFTMHRRVR